jgi:outer membrane lipoprotein-sorting protein
VNTLFSRTVLAALLVPVFVRAEPLADILSRMDRAAQDFRSLTATMKRVQFTAVLSESEETDGTVRLRREKGGTVGVLEFQQPEQRTILIKGKTAQVFYPKANSVEIYDTSKYTSNIDQLLLLGFGSSSTELKKSYDIREGGPQKVGATDTTRIQLDPKSAELKKLITRIEMWFPEGQSNPIRVKFSEPSKNYELVDYSDIKVNPTLPDSAFDLKLPGDVKKIYPQK